MLDKDWIQALPEVSSSRKKEYIITERGKQVAASELIRLQELVLNGEEIIGGE